MSKTKNELKYSAQIAVCKTQSWLIEAIDLLIPTTAKFGPIIHRGEESEAVGDGIHGKSRIRLNIVDYSKGTGEQKIKVYANLTPWRVKYLHHILESYTGNYPFALSEEKILSHTQENGRSPVTKLWIYREDKLDADGKAMKNPWSVTILNGTGVPVKNKNGGIYMQGNSFVETGRGTARLSDIGFFEFVEKCYTYLTIWENRIGGQVVEEYMNLKDQAHKEKEFYENGVVPDDWMPDLLPADHAA